MSTVNSFDKNLHFAELNSPLFTGNPVPTTPAARKAAARANLGAVAANGDSGVRFGNQPLIATATPQAINTTGTATASQLLSGIITSTTAAAVSITLPTGTLMDTAILAAYPNVTTGDVFQFKVSNSGGNAITMVAGSTFTLGGATSVPAGTTAIFYARRNGANSWTLY